MCWDKSERDWTAWKARLTGEPRETDMPVADLRAEETLEPEREREPEELLTRA